MDEEIPPTRWELGDTAGFGERFARMIEAGRLLAIGGLALDALFALLILTSIVPRYVLSPCE